MEKDARNTRSWFTGKEAAALIGVHLDTLYRYTRLRKGAPPFVRLGNSRRYRFPKDKFTAWANGSKQGSTNV